MISQRCPKCGSSRIRSGYRPTPLWSKLLFRFNLLCNNCNWEFRGFAVPGTVSSNPKRSKKKHSEFTRPEKTDEAVEKNKIPAPDKEPVRIKKRVKIRL